MFQIWGAGGSWGCSRRWQAGLCAGRGKCIPAGYFNGSLGEKSLVKGKRLKKKKSLSRVRPFATPWTVAYQSPLSMGFSRKEYWSELPFPSPGDLPDPGIELGSPSLRADALPSESSVSRRAVAVRGLRAWGLGNCAERRPPRRDRLRPGARLPAGDAALGQLQSPLLPPPFDNHFPGSLS